MKRYHAGCAGQFMLHEDSGGQAPLHCTTDDRDEAIVSCGDESAPAGCEVYDAAEKQWIGPSCWEEIHEAQARLDARRAALHA